MLASLTFVELKQYLGGHRFKTYNDAKKRGGAVKNGILMSVDRSPYLTLPRLVSTTRILHLNVWVGVETIHAF